MARAFYDPHNFHVFAYGENSLYCDVFLNATSVYPNGISRLKNTRRMLDIFFDGFLFFGWIFLKFKNLLKEFCKRLVIEIYIFLMHVVIFLKNLKNFRRSSKFSNGILR